MNDPLNKKLKISWRALLSDDKEYGSFLYHTEQFPSLDFIAEAVEAMKDHALASIKELLVEANNLKLKKLNIIIEGHHSIAENFVGSNPKDWETLQIVV